MGLTFVALETMFYALVVVVASDRRPRLMTCRRDGFDVRCDPFSCGKREVVGDD